MQLSEPPYHFAVCTIFSFGVAFSKSSPGKRYSPGECFKEFTFDFAFFFALFCFHILALHILRSPVAYSP